ncbi:hypothetical protein SRHO_G00265360 [Serrasalmus rhombeus]
MSCMLAKEWPREGKVDAAEKLNDTIACLPCLEAMEDSSFGQEEVINSSLPRAECLNVASALEALNA